MRAPPTRSKGSASTSATSSAKDAQSGAGLGGPRQASIPRSAVPRSLAHLAPKAFALAAKRTRVAIGNEAGVAVVRRARGAQMLDWAPVLLGPRRDLPSVRDHAVRVAAIGAVGLFQRVQVRQPFP